MSSKEDVHKLVSTAGLLLVDAMVFHEIIASLHKGVPTLSMMMASKNLKRSLEDAWQYIIDNINYEPVLEIALNILRNMPATHVFDRELRVLANLAYDIASSKVLLRHASLEGSTIGFFWENWLSITQPTTLRFPLPGYWRGF
ncbi:hypothetical protein DRO58_08650 [Candidatus Bathyarchaeota archaeon]|nr:MAG: hypothetical protein DRO58_08650 [Candidatus Bathyarchaeota archaeon]